MHFRVHAAAFFIFFTTSLTLRSFQVASHDRPISVFDLGDPDDPGEYAMNPLQTRHTLNLVQTRARKQVNLDSSAFANQLFRQQTFVGHDNFWYQQPHPSKNLLRKCAFAFLMFGKSPDTLVQARALVKSLRSNGATSDIIAIVPKGEQGLPEAYMNILIEDGVKIHRNEPMPVPPGTLPRWQAVMDKLTIFGMTQYFRVVLMDLDIIVEDGAYPEGVFAECPGQEFCAVPDNAVKGMINAGVMLAQPSEWRFQDMAVKIGDGSLFDKDAIYPEQSVLLHYSKDPDNMFEQAHLPDRYNSCRNGGWQLNIGKGKTGFDMLHACSWGAKYCNIEICKESKHHPCRHSVLLFQKYHAQADQCIAHEGDDECHNSNGCNWCGHYCSSTNIPCSATLFATKDNMNSHVILKANATEGFGMGATQALGLVTDFKTYVPHTPRRVKKGVQSKERVVSSTNAIYYAMIDRVAHPLGSKAEDCHDLSDYCGGTVNGLSEKLDYLSNLGIEGVIISPLLDNFEKGYHGYWHHSLYAFNSHFGKKDDVKKFVKQANHLGMYVVGDLNLNHLGKGIEDVPKLTPFNSSEYYHDCEGCSNLCDVDDWESVRQAEHCRLFGMPDLNQDHPVVRQTLKEFARNYVDEYGFDGLRLDAARHLPASFIEEIAFGAVPGGAPIPIIPEVYTADVRTCAKLAFDRHSPSLNFPLYIQIRAAFIFHSSMFELDSVRKRMVQAMPEPQLLINFVNTHDEPRFLALQPDQALYSNAMVFMMCAEGIPLILYGDEQDMTGSSGSDDGNQYRQPLWHYGYSTETPRYRMIQKVLMHRPKFGHTILVSHHVDDNMLIFSRGQYLVVVSNLGAGHSKLPAQRILYLTKESGLCSVSRFCDIVSGNRSTCVYPHHYEEPENDQAGIKQVTNDAYSHQKGPVECILRVEIGEDGMPLVLAPP